MDACGDTVHANKHIHIYKHKRICTLIHRNTRANVHAHIMHVDLQMQVHVHTNFIACGEISARAGTDNRPPVVPTVVEDEGTAVDGVASASSHHRTAQPITHMHAYRLLPLHSHVTFPICTYSKQSHTHHVRWRS